MTKDQHTTPKCYLKNFSDDEKSIFRKYKRVEQTDKMRNKELNKPISLKSATVIEDFYTVEGGNDPMVVETTVYANHIENEYTEIYKILVDPTVNQFDMVQRRKLLSFFLSLHSRTPKQFDLFIKNVPEQFHFELDKIKEDYKVAHVKEILPALLEAHEFKIVKVVRLTDTSQFITSDNPVLIVGSDNNLKNNEYRQQFAVENIIIIPIDKKHCCILYEGKDKNGIDVRNKLFYNKIIREDVDGSFATSVNMFMLDSVDKYYFGSEKFIKAFFHTFKLV